jgi:hypothetical protein
MAISPVIYTKLRRKFVIFPTTLENGDTAKWQWVYTRQQLVTVALQLTGGEFGDRDEYYTEAEAAFMKLGGAK